MIDILCQVTIDLLPLGNQMKLVYLFTGEMLFWMSLITCLLNDTTTHYLMKR